MRTTASYVKNAEGSCMVQEAQISGIIVDPCFSFYVVVNFDFILLYI